MEKKVIMFVVIAVNNVESTGEMSINSYVFQNEVEAMSKKANLLRSRLREEEDDYFDNQLTEHNITENRRSCLYSSDVRYDVCVQEKEVMVEIEDEENIYVPVQWPEIQEIMVRDGFGEHAYLINDEAGMDVFGSSAYMVEKVWLEEKV